MIPRATRTTILTLTVAMLAVSHLAAVDEIRLKNGQTLRGELLRYDERGIALRIESGRVLQYPLNKVENVGAKLSDPHQQAEQAIDDGRFADAVRHFRNALQQEKRPWALSRIQSGMVKSLAADAQWAEAGEAFLQMVVERNDAEVMALAPLIWIDSHKPNTQTIQLAKQWLHDERPMARLLAASWLLGTIDGKAARDVMDQLTTFPEQRISWLARAQLWRGGIAANEDEIDRFRLLIEKMPEPIRAGPQFVLAQAYEKSGKAVDAALAYLWIAYVYAPQSPLAAEATLRAAQSAEKAGLHPDAHKLFREVMEKHPGTEWASAAETHLDNAAKASSSNERN